LDATFSAAAAPKTAADSAVACREPSDTEGKLHELRGPYLCGCSCFRSFFYSFSLLSHFDFVAKIFVLFNLFFELLLQDVEKTEVALTHNRVRLVPQSARSQEHYSLTARGKAFPRRLQLLAG
jgi:hypothetical protein